MLPIDAGAEVGGVEPGRLGVLRVHRGEQLTPSYPAGTAARSARAGRDPSRGVHVRRRSPQSGRKLGCGRPAGAPAVVNSTLLACAWIRVPSAASVWIAYWAARSLMTASSIGG